MTRKNLGPAVSIALAVIITTLDRIVKVLTVRHIAYASETDLIPGVLGLTHYTNTGAAFGMLKGHRTLFIVITFLATAVIVYFLFRMKTRSALWFTAAGFVLGGAAGNLIDRMSTGEVVDMFEFLFVRFAVFNVADAFITTGCGLLILYFILDMVREQKQKNAVKKESEGNDGQNDPD